MNAFKKTFHTLYQRAYRLGRHVLFPLKDQYLLSLIKCGKTGLLIVHYVGEVPLLVLDILGLPEFFSFFQSVFKRNARSLQNHELQMALHIFRDSFDFSKARIDENSRIGTRGGKYVFVSFYYINCKGTLDLPVLIHELAHVLQFEQCGSPYAFRNMMAHIFPPTYDYGGLERITGILRDPNSLHILNYEQRADIFSDYCLLLSGRIPEWGIANSSNLGQYYEVISLLTRK
ncbi:MAG: hypothetical protein ABI761_13360 [Saprospiraceae bacterium]